jgi:hypothetical protein
VLATLALVALAQGCATPRIRIERSCPPCIPLDPTAKVGLEIVVEGGPGPGKIESLTEAVLGGQLLDRRAAAEPVGQELDRHLRMADHPVVDPRAADVVFRACPTHWSYQGPALLHPGQNGSGYLRVFIEVLRANNPGAPCIYSATYWSRVQAPDERLAISRAADRVADGLVADLRPSRICNVVEMDNCDPRAKTGIELCERGQFDAAYSAFSDLAAQAPDSAPVLYDFAVLKESRGEYNDAEALLLRATQKDPKGIYYIALERVRAARRDAEALGKTP